MDSRNTALAKLVLGYLKSEKCKSAYNEFLQNSACFQRYSSSQSKYIATRYIGLTLEDIFFQYSDLSQIIQGRLEATNYYYEQHPNETLVDQLQYLLSNGPLSRPSTPGVSSQRSDRDEVSPTHSDVDATQIDALPGNSPGEKYFSPKRKSGNKHGWKALATSSPSSSFEVQRSDIINSEVLAESLLENKEFHEKIAQTINKVVERQFDSTVKEVMQETERDPIFDQILEEIVGTSTNEMSKEIGSNDIITSSPCTSLDNEKEKVSNCKEKSPEKVQKPNKEKHINSNNNCTSLPDNPLGCTPQLSGSEQVSNLENYFLAVPTTPSISNPFYFNTMTSLLMPPITTVVVNKPPQSSAFITEQDIMKMPVILNDDRNIAANHTENKEKENISPKTPAVPKASASPKELQDFFKNYRPDETNQLSTVKKTGLKRVIYPKQPNKSQNSTKEIDNLPEIISTNTATSTTSNEKECTNKNSNSDSKSKTPLPDPTKKTTPKSSSHIRSLNFTTPPKSNLSQKPPESDAKKVVKTLFDKSKARAWDSDLREIVKSDLPLTKRAAVKKKQPRKGRKPKIAKSEKIPEPEKIAENSNENESINSKETVVDKDEQFITPVTAKEPVVVNPTKAICNITSMLETPYKTDQHPKTPGVATPMNFNDDGTPFTKMLDANLNGVDINSIETPSLLNTPGFPPITPNIDMLSPYPNRPTDYSTGSSYYQPSDSEQNKILEAEVRKVEKNYSELTINLTDHMKHFNKNIIGKKNLNLLKNDLSDCSVSSNENVEDNSSWCGKESNDTVIFKKKTETPKKFYSLRNRVKKVDVSATKKPAKKDKKPPSTACFVTKQSPIEEDKTKSKKSDQPLSKEELSEQYSLARELERKRLKIVNSLKEANEAASKVKKQTNGKFKIKPIAKVFTSKASKKRKRNKEMLKTVMNDLRTSDDSELDLSLSENEEIEEKNLEKSKADKTVSDVEAQNLIDGLKERGIHLMHNKSPKKQHADNKEVLSASQILESMDREIFDTFTTDECISIVHDGKNKASTVDKPKASESDQMEYIGKLYLERIDKEVDIHLKPTDFFLLLDMAPKSGKTSPAEAVQCGEIKKATNIPDSKVDEGLTNFTSTRKEKIEENSPKKSRKRRFSDHSESEKTCTKMLKSLDLDVFLNIIHQEKENKPKK